MAIRIVEINLGTSGYSGFSGSGGGSSGASGYSGYSGPSGYSGSGVSGFSGVGESGFSGFSGTGADGASGFSGFSGPGGGNSGFSGFTGTSGYSGYSGQSGFSGFTGASGQSGYSGFSGVGTSGFSGFSGVGTSGFSGFSGPTGADGASGFSGFTGVSGYSGFTGQSGFSGFSGVGTSGFSGFSGVSGYSGFSGPSGYSGFSGPSGYSGFSGPSGYSGFTGISGYSGFSGVGTSGFSGFTGVSGYSGFSGPSGYSGFSGPSGYSGFSGPSGYSGFSGPSGYSGFTGVSGFSGFSGPNLFLFTEQPTDYTLALTDANMGVAMNSASANNLTVPANATVAFPVGTQIAVQQLGAGTTTVVAAGGVTIQASTLVLSNQYAVAVLIKKATNTWLMSSGSQGTSGYSGFTGSSGYSGFSGANPGASGYSGFSGVSGYSGFTGVSGYSGFSGKSGYSGFSGPSLLPTNEQTNDYTLVITDAETCVAMNKASANNLTVPPNSSVAFDVGTQIVIEQRGAGTTTIVAGAGVTINAVTLVMGTQYSTVVLVKQATDLWLLSVGAQGTSGYSGFSGVSGYSGFSGVSGFSGFTGISGFSGAPNVPKISVTQKTPLQLIAGTIVSKAGTVTGTAGVGSSLFLQRLYLPAAMSLTEIDCLLSIGFPATSQGAGTMSRSMAIYSFGNSTSLATVVSASGTSAWNTGTSTAGASSSLTQFQGGWSSPLIQPMTLASSTLAAGEYVVGQLFNFAQGSSTWTLNFYGAVPASSLLASAATNLTSATLGAMSVALVAGSGITGISSYASQFLALSTAGSLTAFILSQTASSAASSFSGPISTGGSQLALSITNTAKSVSFQLKGESSNSNIVSSIGVNAGSVVNGSTTLGAVTNVALGALNSSTLAQLTLPNFGYIGTGSTTSNFPTVFMVGIMSTGAIPTAISVTAAAVTMSGSVAYQQPWFRLIGS